MAPGKGGGRFKQLGRSMEELSRLNAPAEEKGRHPDITWFAMTSRGERKMSEKFRGKIKGKQEENGSGQPA